MQKIIPHLWFDTQAKEAAELYVSTFQNGSKIRKTYTLKDTPGGDAEAVIFELFGMEFQATSAGPYFKPNPSLSFMVFCESPEEVERYWKSLKEGGKELMELGEYPFSKKYAWVEDRYGFSWQLFCAEDPITQKIQPSMLFVEENAGKAEEAINYYVSVFRNSKIDGLYRYDKSNPTEKEGTIMHGAFVIENTQISAADSALMHDFKFTEALSLIINCENQEEIDYYWEKLSADREAEQCGWLKDKYGFSWQVVPAIMNEMLEKGDQETLNRVTQAFLPMKKLIIADLEKAAKGD